MFLEYHTDINTHRPATNNILFSVFCFFFTNIAYVQLWERPVESSTWTLGEDALCPVVCCVGGPTWIKCPLMDPTSPRSEWDQFRAWVKTLYFLCFPWVHLDSFCGVAHCQLGGRYCCQGVLCGGVPVTFVYCTQICNYIAKEKCERDTFINKLHFKMLLPINVKFSHRYLM